MRIVAPSQSQRPPLRVGAPAAGVGSGAVGSPAVMLRCYRVGAHGMRLVGCSGGWGSPPAQAGEVQFHEAGDVVDDAQGLGDVGVVGRAHRLKAHPLEADNGLVHGQAELQGQ